MSWKRVSAWIAGLTAVLTLAFGLQRIAGTVSDWHVRTAKTKELMAAADEQRGSQHYAEAWASLAEAEKLKPDDEPIRQAQENLAMQWLRAARVREGEQTFTELVKPLVPLLERGAVHAQGARKADLIAHVGWADFLRWRDGAHELAPDASYRRAIQLDANNPFAHAMWGHWLLFTSDDVAAARAHFDTALQSGRERAYVRYMQISALLNSENRASDQELQRVVEQMRQTGERIDDDESSRVQERLARVAASSDRAR